MKYLKQNNAIEEKFNSLFTSKSAAWLIFSIVLFLICYGLVANDYLYNHDSVDRMYNGISSLDSGRFMRKPLNDLLSFGTYNPINASFLTYLFLSLSAVALYKLFEIKSLFQKVIILMVIYSYPILAFFWAYGNDIWQYSLALLLSIMAVTFVTSNTAKGRIVTVVLITMFLGIYQSILSTMTMTFIGYYIWQVYKTEQFDWKNFIINFFTLIIGAIFYFITLNIILMITGTELTSYRGADEVGVLRIIKMIPHSIVISIKDFYQFVMAKGDFFGTDYNFRIIQILISMAYPLLVIKSIFIKQNRNTSLIVLGLCALVPILVNSSLFITGVVNNYSQFGYIIFYVFAIIIYLNEFASVITYFIILLLLYCNWSEVNAMLFVEQSQTQLNEQIANQIAIDIQSFDEYENGDQIRICGELRNNDTVSFSYMTKYQFTESKLKTPENIYLFRSEKPWKLRYLLNNIGFDFNILNIGEECEDTINFTNEYPKQGYIMKEDNIVYVNLGGNQL